MKTHLDQPNDICQSCDVPYREHIGIAATCLALQRARENISLLRGTLGEIINEVEIYIDDDAVIEAIADAKKLIKRTGL